MLCSGKVRLDRTEPNIKYYFLLICHLLHTSLYSTMIEKGKGYYDKVVVAALIPYQNDFLCLYVYIWVNRTELT